MTDAPLVEVRPLPAHVVEEAHVAQVLNGPTKPQPERRQVRGTGLGQAALLLLYEGLAMEVNRATRVELDGAVGVTCLVVLAKLARDRRAKPIEHLLHTVTYRWSTV